MFHPLVSNQALEQGFSALLEAALFNDAECWRLTDEVVAVYDDVNGHSTLLLGL